VLGAASVDGGNNQLKLNRTNQIFRKHIVSAIVIFAICHQSTSASDINQANDPVIGSRTASNSSHWSLPFEGELNAKIPDQPANNGIETATAQLSVRKDVPQEQHPFPVGSSYHVLTLSTPLLQEAENPPIKTGKIIKAHVTAWDGPISINQIINYLVDKNYANSPQAQKLDKQLKHLQKLPAKSIAVSKDSLQHALNYQGFDPSIRASNLILDKKYTVRNNAWAEYERQKYVDQIHLQVVTSMMQIAEGLGMPDPVRGTQLVSVGKDALQTVVGPDEAARSVKGLKTWLNTVKVPAASFAQTPWSTIDRNKKLEDVVKTTIKKDPVVNEVTKKLEHYSNPGKVKAASAHVIETTLNGIALLAPGFAIPLGAAAAEGGFQQSTGGSEENKLERELLLDKRIQSRLKVVSQEAALALDNYRFALVTKNPSLLAFTQEMLGNMTGSLNSVKIVSSANDVKNYTETVPLLR
jgi:hypothetical protein